MSYFAPVGLSGCVWPVCVPSVSDPVALPGDRYVGLVAHDVEAAYKRASAWEDVPLFGLALIVRGDR